MDIKTILPVCRYCRRVCDQRDYWLFMPGSLHKRQEVRRRPTICPLCRGRRVPVDIEELQSK
jgi:hypothetical protein